MASYVRETRDGYVFISKFGLHLEFGASQASDILPEKLLIWMETTELHLQLDLVYCRILDHVMYLQREPLNCRVLSARCCLQVYQSVILKERKGEYLGKTVQVVPHITDEIQVQQDGMASSSWFCWLGITVPGPSHFSMSHPPSPEKTQKCGHLFIVMFYATLFVASR